MLINNAGILTDPGLAPSATPIERLRLTSPLLAYNSSKTALNAITLAYANELRDAGILVNAVSPGSVATDRERHAEGRAVPW